MFDFCRKSAGRRARTRAAAIRGIVPQLAHASWLALTCYGEPRTPAGEPVFVLRSEGVPIVSVYRRPAAKPAQ